MTEETLGRPSCLPTSRPDLKPTQSPSLRGWRNTRLARKEQQHNSVDCDCARRLMDSKKPVFFNFSMQNINWLQESFILGVRAFIVRETQSDSGRMLRKKIDYLSYMLHAPPFAICTQHISSYENLTIFVLRNKPSRLDILRKFHFSREDRKTK